MSKIQVNVIVTGCSGQLGSAFCKSLNDAGARVIGIDKKKPIDDVEWLFEEVDVTDEIQVMDFYKKLDFIPNVLINNAGIGVFTPTLERTAKEFMDLLGVNLLSVMLMSNGFIKKCNKNGGHVINLGSIYGHRSSDFRIYGTSKRNNSEAYTASKAGVIAMTKYYAAHFGQNNFRFNSVSPGGVLRNQSTDFLSEYSKKTPSSRLALDSEIASVVSYLALNSPNYLNGTDILVDGGYTAW